VTIQYCESFLLEQLQAVHDFSSDAIKLALFDSNASFSRSTTAYSTSNELVGGGYTAGGQSLTLASGYPKIETTASGGIMAAVRFEIPAATWTFTDVLRPAWALMYNASQSDKAILSIRLGSRAAVGPYSITFPLSINPIIHISAP